MTHDGLLFHAQGPEQATKTLAAINGMVEELFEWQQDETIEAELARSWHDE
jgi:hypothetical protein